MAAPDPRQTIITLLTATWVAANTDGHTPEIKKITDYKRFDTDINQDLILVWVPETTDEPAGTGPAHKHETNRVNLDIRIFGADQEQHFLNVLEETKRILEAKKVLPSADYTILEFNGQGQDLSDKMRGMWRKLIPTQLIRYNVVR